MRNRPTFFVQLVGMAIAQELSVGGLNCGREP
jgi:hypothetical protein